MYIRVDFLLAGRMSRRAFSSLEKAFLTFSLLPRSKRWKQIVVLVFLGWSPILGTFLAFRWLAVRWEAPLFARLFRLLLVHLPYRMENGHLEPVQGWREIGRESTRLACFPREESLLAFGRQPFSWMSTKFMNWQPIKRNLRQSPCLP